MIKPFEINIFLDLYCRDGWVLDFSTENFDAFTTKSIGIPLCKRYKISKGKSLKAYSKDASEPELFKLFADLFEYYERIYKAKNEDKQFEKQYENCKKIIARENKTIPNINAPTIKHVNRDYIKDIAARANRDIDNKEFDSALTKARTLLEEVFCHSIEERNEIPSDKGDIGKLYSQVKSLYKMHYTQEIDNRVKSLLSGLEKILTAIREMRNSASDSHGVGSRRMKIEDHHARLFVNSAITMAEFILAVAQKQNKEKPDEEISQ